MLLITFLLNIHSSLELQIQLTHAQTLERDEIGFSTPYSRMTFTPQSKMASTTNPLVAPTQQTPCSQFRVLTIRASSSAPSSQTGLMDMAQFTEVWPSPSKPQILNMFHLRLCKSKTISRLI